MGATVAMGARLSCPRRQEEQESAWGDPAEEQQLAEGRTERVLENWRRWIRVLQRVRRLQRVWRHLGIHLSQNVDEQLRGRVQRVYLPAERSQQTSWRRRGQ